MWLALTVRVGADIKPQQICRTWPLTSSPHAERIENKNCHSLGGDCVSDGVRSRPRDGDGKRKKHQQDTQKTEDKTKKKADEKA